MSTLIIWFSAVARWLAMVIVLTCCVGTASAVEKVWNPLPDPGLNSRNWFLAANWGPTGVPTTNDNVTIALPYDDNPCVGCGTQTETAAINNLTISGGGHLFSGSAAILVDAPGVLGMTTVTGPDSQLTLNAGRSSDDLGIRTDNLQLLDGATLLTFNGWVVVDNTMDVDADALFFANQPNDIHWVFNNQLGSSGTLLNFRGTLNVDFADLTIDATSGGLIDLDGQGAGAGNSTIQVRNGDFTANCDLSDPYDGVLNLRHQSSATFSDDLTIAGELRFEGSLTSGGAVRDLIAPSFTLNGLGQINVQDGARGRIVSSASFNAASSVDLESDSELEIAGATVWFANSVLMIHEDAQLQHSSTTRFDDSSTLVIDGTLINNGFTTYAGATIMGTGTIQQKGDSTVTLSTTINLDPVSGIFDWDGTTSGQTMTIAPNQRFTINASRIDIADGNDDDVIVQTGATLEVNTTQPWRMEGMLTLVNADLAGQEMVLDQGGTLHFQSSGFVDAPVTIFGRVTLDSTADFDALTTFESTAQVVIGAGDRIDLNAQTVYRGGSFTGGGRLDQRGDAVIEANTIISVAVYDWDGAGASEVTVNTGTSFTINANSIDPSGDGYDGTATVSGTLAVNTPAEWTLDGTIVLMDGRINGTKFGVGGVDTGAELHAVSGIGRVNADVDFRSGAELLVQNGATLQFNGATRFESGSDVQVDGTLRLLGSSSTWAGPSSVMGVGTLQFGPQTSIANPTTIRVDRLDLDGFAEVGTVTVDGTLTLDTLEIDNDNIFDGTLNVNGFARLDVNLRPGGPYDSWEMAGTLNIDASNVIPVDSLDGSRVLLSGEVNTIDLVRFAAPVDISGQVNITDADGEITLTGGITAIDENTLAGGVINGPGTLRASSPQTFVGHGTIAAAINFNGSSRLLARDGTLNLTGNIVDLGQTIGTANNFATLNVTNPLNTGLANELRLAGGQVTGAGIINNGITVGMGTVSGQSFDNNGTVSADGGTLTFDLTTSPDWDGTGNAGMLNAVDGDIAAVNNASAVFAMQGIVSVGLGRRLELQNGGFRLESGGRMNLAGGTYAAPKFENGSLLNTSVSESVIDAESQFASGSITQLGAALRLIGQVSIAEDAQIGGIGRLIFDANSTVTLENLAIIEASVSNAGLLRIGSNLGSATVNELTMMPDGVLQFDLAGTIAGVTHDQLLLDGEMSAGGTLQVNYLGRFQSQIGQQFVLISALDGVVDDFLDIQLPPSPTGGMWSLGNIGQELILSVILAGDYNADGRVDAADYTVWRDTEGSSGMVLAADGNGDNIVDSQDYDVWRSNFGATVGSLVPAANLAPGESPGGAVPEPSAFLIVTIIVMISSCKRLVPNSGAN